LAMKMTLVTQNRVFLNENLIIQFPHIQLA
jgi:hypothetical protein